MRISSRLRAAALRRGFVRRSAILRRGFVRRSAIAAFACCGLLAVLAPSPALATGLGALERLGNLSVQQIIGNVIKAFLGVVGSLSLLMFVYGGFTWMTAAGNDEKIKKAKNTVVWAALGLIVMFASYTLVRFVFTSLGSALPGK